MKHKAYLSFIGRTQKTAKTECGKTVKVTQLAIDCDADCPDCRAEVDRTYDALASVAAFQKKEFGPSAAIAEVEKAAHEPRQYSTAYFF